MVRSRLYAIQFLSKVNQAEIEVKLSSQQMILVVKLYSEEKILEKI
jgi:hypothetical protein